MPQSSRSVSTTLDQRFKGAIVIVLALAVFILTWVGLKQSRSDSFELLVLQGTAFTEALLWLDVERSLILRARIGMENGSVRTVTLTNVRLDPPADSQRFRFAIPAGAQVIRRDG